MGKGPSNRKFTSTCGAFCGPKPSVPPTAYEKRNSLRWGLPQGAKLTPAVRKFEKQANESYQNTMEASHKRAQAWCER